MAPTTSIIDVDEYKKEKIKEHPWAAVEIDLVDIKKSNATKLEELETQRTILTDLETGLTAAKQILERDRAESQHSEDYLAAVEDSPKKSVPEFVLTKEQQVRLDNYGGFENFLNRQPPPEPKNGFWKKFIHSAPNVWKKPYEHVVARLAPIVSMAASAALAMATLATAPLVVPAAVVLLGASGFVTVTQHRDAKVRSRAAHDSETIKLGRIASKGYFERSSGEQRLLWDTTYGNAVATRIRHPFLSSRWAELHPEAITAVRELEEKKCILRYMQLQVRTTDSELAKVNKNIEIRRDELDFARQSILGFDAWRRLAGWDVSDDMTTKANRTRELRAEYRARAALDLPEIEPETGIDLASLNAINAAQDGGTTKDAEPPVVIASNGNGNGHKAIEISHSTLEPLSRTADRGTALDN